MTSYIPPASAAADHIGYKKAGTLYRRAKSGKYVAVTDPWAYDGLREGSWFVQVRPGSTTIRQAVYPDRMEIQAALGDLEDQLMDIIREACAARPSKAVLSPEEKRAWDRLMKVGGDSFSTVHYGSLQGIVDRVLDRVKERVGERTGVVPQQKP